MISRRVSMTCKNLFKLWIFIAMTSLLLTYFLFQTQFPLFSIIYLTIPFIVSRVKKDVKCIGFSAVKIRLLIKVTLLNLATALVLIGLCEPWSHIYGRLIELSKSAKTPDSTFIWLDRYPGWGVILMFIFTGIVSIFAEELFYRGLLLQTFKKRMKPFAAILLQATFFALPNIIVAFFMTTLQGVLYVLVYAFLAIGVIGGFVAHKTGSIWPSLISAIVLNLLIIIIYL